MATINILCATDKNFVPYCGIMLTSLFENNKENAIHVYLLIDETVSTESRKQFAELAKQYNQIIDLIIVDGSQFEKYPVYNKQWNNSIYYRLLAAELLPDTIDKIIYLDCDIIITGDLSPMWNTNINDHAIAAVPDIWSPKQSVYDRLNLHNDGLYFNSGSLIFNLKYWREHHLSDQYMEYLRRNFDRLWFNDQDILNGVLYNQKQIMPIEYNYQVLFLQKELHNEFLENMRQEMLATKLPLVIHYAASTKPWMILYYKMPFLDEWHKYRDMSYWKHTPNKLPKTKVINWLIKRYILWPLHIMKPQEYITL